MSDNRMSDEGLAGAIRALHHPEAQQARLLRDERPGSRDVLAALRRGDADGRKGSTVSGLSSWYVPAWMLDVRQSRTEHSQQPLTRALPLPHMRGRRSGFAEAGRDVSTALESMARGRPGGLRLTVPHVPHAQTPPVQPSPGRMSQQRSRRARHRPPSGST